MYEEFGISANLEELAQKTENKLINVFNEIDKRCMKNSIKVLKAFQNNNISQMHFNFTNGYGYSDVGRDAIEKIFAEVLKAEDALVRNQFISGTHALTVALFGLLRPNDILLSISGKPYDTLDTVIGLEKNDSSLESFGIKYEQIDLINNDFDYEKIQNRVKKGNIKVIEIQRSRGYSTRQSITVDKIEKVIKLIKSIDENIIIMVDNCYGEFVDEKEPTEFGADIIVGSLIKNLGGGIASNGAYIAGKSKLVALCAERLTSPGLGKEVGPSLGANKSFLQGIFMAPEVVASSLKTAIFTSKIFEELGYKVDPKYNEKRSDIVQTIEFGNEHDLIKYVQGIQKGSVIDSSCIPMPWDMPGYTNKVIMASGAFTMGSSIELSCDAPIKEPYIAFQQGGLTYEYGKLGVLKAIQNIFDSNNK